MANTPLKKTVCRLAVVASFALALTGTAQSLDPQYTLDEVIDGCTNAYGNGQQIDQCIINVCGTYGCEGW